MKSNYSYPIEYSLYSTNEIIQLIQFFEQIEKYYQGQAIEEKVLEHYQIFCKLVPGKADRTKMYKQFLLDSGYDIYKVISILTKNSKK